MMKYQSDYSKINPSLFDESTRIVKAEKISRIIRDFAQKNPKICTCLEVGCSTGINTNYLSGCIGACIGTDIDMAALQYAHAHSQHMSEFIAGDAMYLPFRNGFFDIIICNHVYEHVPDSQVLMKEIFRCLKIGGFCYFAAGNKFSVMEGHYHLPFLSWLPRPVSNLYLKATKKGTVYYEKHLSYFQLKRLTRQFDVTDYTLKVIREPGRFGADDMIHHGSFIPKIPTLLLKGLFLFIPTYIFILTKKHDKEMKN
jgi:ubiquinone/menaquinone biosynthesis C-methylase UbiE